MRLLFIWTAHWILCRGVSNNLTSCISSTDNRLHRNAIEHWQTTTDLDILFLGIDVIKRQVSGTEVASLKYETIIAGLNKWAYFRMLFLDIKYVNYYLDINGFAHWFLFSFYLNTAAESFTCNLNVYIHFMKTRRVFAYILYIGCFSCYQVRVFIPPDGVDGSRRDVASILSSQRIITVTS